jgi:hypothetical protein
VGGATIIERIYLRKGLKFVFTPNGRFYWNGIIWVADEGGSHILWIMREELVKVEKGYLAERRSNLKAQSDEASMESNDECLTDSGTAGPGGSGKKKEPKIVNFNFNAKMSNVLPLARTCSSTRASRGSWTSTGTSGLLRTGSLTSRPGPFSPTNRG